jgi:DNA-binding MarR family transcriptional regulator
MTSIFDLSTQHQDVSSKIVVGLDRLSQAVRVLLWEEAKRHDLSPIQIQFLIFLHYHSLEFGRVSTLAKEFGLTQATVSDAVTSLASKSLLYRAPWPQDKRVITLRLTSMGAEVALKLSTWPNIIREQLNQFSPNEQEMLMKFLMQLIESLQKAGIITIARLCLTCQYFQSAAQPDTASSHFCRLLEKSLATSDLRLDCPEHQLLL